MKKNRLLIILTCVLLLFSAAVFLFTNETGKDLLKATVHGVQNLYFKVEDLFTGGVNGPAPTHTAEESATFDLNNYSTNFLTEREKQAVATLDSLAKTMSTEVVPVRSIPIARFEEVANMFLYDHPEYFYVENISYLKNGNNQVTAVSIGYTHPTAAATDRKNKIEQIASPIVEQAKTITDEAERVYFLHGFVVKNTEYQLDSPDNQNMSSVFLNRKSACAGYAKSLVYLLRSSGMQAMYVTGSTSGMPHAFVMVRIDGKLYYVDPTLDDPVFKDGTNEFSNYSGTAYLCVTTDMLKISHTIDEDYYTLPVCTDLDANYHQRNGTLFTQDNKETIAALQKKVTAAVEGKEKYVAFRFTTDKEEYDSFMSSLFSRKNSASIFKMLYDITKSSDNLVRYDAVNYYAVENALYCVIELDYIG